MTANDGVKSETGPFWLYYLKSWIWTVLLVAPFLGHWRGLSWAASWGVTGLVFVGTIVAMWFSHRQRVQASKYVPPTDVRLAPIAGEARVSPDRLHDSRGNGVLGWGIIILTFLVVVGVVVWAFATVDDPGVGFTVTMIAMFIVFIAWIVLTTFYASTRPALGRGARVAADHPRGVVVTGIVSDTDNPGVVLASILGLPVKGVGGAVPSMSTILIDDRGLSFWRGWTHPREQYLVPWALIGPVTPKQVEISTGRASPVRLAVAVQLREHEDDGSDDALEVAFMPARPSMFMAVPFRSPAVVESVASEIDSRRPRA